MSAVPHDLSPVGDAAGAGQDRQHAEAEQQDVLEPGRPGVLLEVVALGAAVLGVVVPGVLLEVVALGVPLAETVGVAVRVPPGENAGGVADGEPDEQADTDAVASMAKAAQPSTVPRKRRRP